MQLDLLAFIAFVVTTDLDPLETTRPDWHGHSYTDLWTVMHSLSVYIKFHFRGLIKRKTLHLLRFVRRIFHPIA